MWSGLFSCWYRATASALASLLTALMKRSKEIKLMISDIYIYIYIPFEWFGLTFWVVHLQLEEMQHRVFITVIYMRSVALCICFPILLVPLTLFKICKKHFVWSCRYIYLFMYLYNPPDEIGWNRWKQI